MDIDVKFDLLQLLNAYSILQSVYELNEMDSFALELLEDALNTIEEHIANLYRKGNVTGEDVDRLYDTQRLLFDISRNFN